MIYINVGEMCFIPMNVHNELFNGVRQLRWRHLSPVVSALSTSIHGGERDRLNMSLRL